MQLAVSGSSDDESESSSQKDEVMSDLEDDLVQLDFAVESEKSWCTMEDEELNCIEALASGLRERPLVPPKPRDLSTQFPDCSIGISFPACHCAFEDCPWTSACMPCYHRFPESGIWSGHDGMWRFLERCGHGPCGAVACCGDSACLR